MNAPLPTADQLAHVGLPIPGHLNVPRVQFTAICLHGALDRGNDADRESLEQNESDLRKGAEYAEALLQIATSGTRDQMVRHLTWMRDRLVSDARARRRELNLLTA